MKTLLRSLAVLMVLILVMTSSISVLAVDKGLKFNEPQIGLNGLRVIPEKEITKEQDIQEALDLAFSILKKSFKIENINIKIAEGKFSEKLSYGGFSEIFCVDDTYWIILEKQNYPSKEAKRTYLTNEFLQDIIIIQTKEFRSSLRIRELIAASIYTAVKNFSSEKVKISHFDKDYTSVSFSGYSISIYFNPFFILERMEKEKVDPFLVCKSFVARKFAYPKVLTEKLSLDNSNTFDEVFEFDGKTTPWEKGESIDFEGNIFVREITNELKNSITFGYDILSYSFNFNLSHRVRIAIVQDDSTEWCFSFVHTHQMWDGYHWIFLPSGFYDSLKSSSWNNTFWATVILHEFVHIISPHNNGVDEATVEMTILLSILGKPELKGRTQSSPYMLIFKSTLGNQSNGLFYILYDGKPDSYNPKFFYNQLLKAKIDPKEFCQAYILGQTERYHEKLKW